MIKQISLPLLASFTLGACAPNTLPPEEGAHRTAVSHLKQARNLSLSTEQRAVLCLEAANEAVSLLDSPSSGESARKIYNQAAIDLTTLLRSADQGKLWNRPLTLSSGEITYRLRFAKRTQQGIWDPNHFTSLTPASEVDLKTIKSRNRQDGLGGALVGIHKPDPLAPFSPAVGVTAPVTALLDFNNRDATLSLVDPTEKSKARVFGRDRILEADFSAPLAYYPQKSEMVEGIMGAIRVSQYMKSTGLYMIQPYDPDRIPLIFVHGLISTPRMWRNVINELEKDPVLRQRYQCWLFAYPTGNPPLYSAMRLRDELAKIQHHYPNSKDMVLVGHSMGGILSHMQVKNIDRDAWDAIGKDTAQRFFAKVKQGDLIHRATIFKANPHVDRAIFICTPHRGSEMAISTIGELAIRLITLPVDIASAAATTVGTSLSIATGKSNRVPNSIDGLSPRNPTLKVLDTRPFEVPNHSIIGDRGKGDTPNSSDGVVHYWSSHQKSAESEKIVPGPHGACEMPETLTELRRLLHLHLNSN